MKSRIGAFLALPLASIDRLALGANLRGIGEMEGTTATKHKAS
jgi:arsenate reductase